MKADETYRCIGCFKMTMKPYLDTSLFQCKCGELRTESFIQGYWRGVEESDIALREYTRTPIKQGR